MCVWGLDLIYPCTSRKYFIFGLFVSHPPILCHKPGEELRILKRAFHP